jgi:hypothetical protein
LGRNLAKGKWEVKVSFRVGKLFYGWWSFERERYMEEFLSGILKQ